MNDPVSCIDIFLAVVIGKSGFDLIIDDGCHNLYSQIACLFSLEPYLAKGGFYVIEDVQDIDSAREMATMFRGNLEDLRHVKGRYDDILVWWKKK